MSIKRLVLLCALVVLGALSVSQVLSVTGRLQYVLPTPKVEQQEEKKPAEEKEETEPKKTAAKQTALEGLLKGLTTMLSDNPDLVDARMAVAYQDKVQVSVPGGQSQSVRVQGLWGDTHMLPAPILTAGRTLYQEELETGRAVAVLDEKTAVKLFRTGAPLDGEFTLGNVTYKVVGVIRHAQTPGEQEPLRLMVPLLSLDKQAFQTELLSFSFRTLPGKGAYSRMKGLLNGWQAGGTLYSLAKEKQRSLLPVRFLLCLVAVMALGLLLTVLKNLSRAVIRREQAALRNQYAKKLLPRWMLKGLGLLIAWAAWLLALFLVCREAIAPVYVFPEWVPAVLVEWKDMAETFWNNRADVTRLIEMRTPDILFLRFYHRVLLVACTAVFVLLLKPFYKAKGRLKG